MDADAVVVVLGASGLLGQALMKTLAERGRPAIGLSRRSGLDLAKLNSPQALAQALASALGSRAACLVVNAAALTRLEYCEQHADEACALHARLPALLAAWARSTGVTWVQVSTDHYFCGPENRLHDEHAPVLLLNEYARSKHAGEVVALQSPQALVLRTNIVGRRGWPGQPSFAEWAVSALQAGQPFAGYTDSWASSMEASQCAAALLDLADRGARGLLNVASRDSISKADFIAGLAQALGLSSQHLHRQPRPSGRLPRANALGLDVQRAERLLGRPLPSAQQVAERVAAAFADTQHFQPACTQPA
jgi:dTDP-4-dehydrorhamnose reductase